MTKGGNDMAKHRDNPEAPHTVTGSNGVPVVFPDRATAEKVAKQVQDAKIDPAVKPAK
jgi:hypothetical protein